MCISNEATVNIKISHVFVCRFKDIIRPIHYQNSVRMLDSNYNMEHFIKCIKFIMYCIKLKFFEVK